MTPAELLCAREYLGLSKAWVAEHIGVDLKTLWRYESGKSPIPPQVSEAMFRLLEHTADVVNGMTVRGNKVKTTGASLATYQDSQQLVGFPPGWHRMVCSRVAERTGLGITWVLADHPAA